MDTNPPEQHHPEIEMPAPSFWPIVLAFGLLLMAVGVLFSLIVSLVGVIVLLTALVGWTLENRVEAGGEEAETDDGESHGAAVYDADAASPEESKEREHE